MNEVNLSNSALERIEEVRNKESNRGKFLRISISGGGCNGFQYLFNLDDKLSDDDIVISKKNSETLAVTDQPSLPFLDGAEIDFIRELGASYFKVNNPNAKTKYGCGSSFSI